jgi:glycosyltransferase involved in cell wall biosynthesis
MVNETVPAPFFSIILPTYNRRDRIGSAVRSVLNQTFGDWELVIIDDGSTDGTGDAIRTFTDSRIFYQYQENRWPAAARNAGIRRARGRYICFLDSDDQYLENHLSVLYANIVSRNYPDAFFHTFAYQLGEAEMTRKEYDPGDYNKIVIGKNPEINSICISAAVLSVMKFDERLHIHEDAELWGRIAAVYPVLTVPEYTTVTVAHGGSITSDSYIFFKGMEKTYRLVFSDPRNIHSRLAHSVKKQRMDRIKYNVFRYALLEKRYLEAARCVIGYPSIVFFRKFRRLIRSYSYRTLRYALRSIGF